MKSYLPLFALVLSVATAPAASAAMVSAQPLPDNPMPVYPATLTANGITRGRAVFALSIAADGQVKDLLPLAYTNARFATAGAEALREWRFRPARLDGETVPVQLELRVEFSLEGAVITSNITDHYLYDRFEYAGPNAYTYHPVGASRADHPPVRLQGATPAYADGAVKAGITGKVSVRFYIDEHGAVRLPAVEEPVHPYLMQQAMAAVRGWKFAPITSHGEPVLVVARQEFNFVGGK